MGDSQFESKQVFDALEERKIDNVIAWRRLKGRTNPSDVLTVKDRIDVEGPEHLQVIYKRLTAKAESLNGRVKARLANTDSCGRALETPASTCPSSCASSTPSL